MIKIAVIDDHIVLRSSLAALIMKDTGFEVVMQASNGYDFIKQVRSRRVAIPDIVLLDITMPKMGGMETAQWLKANYPDTRIIVLSMLHNDCMIIRMLANGVRAYLSKACEPGQLYDAIRSVYKHGYYYNEFITSGRSKKSIAARLPQLSPQELVFIRWVCTEKTYKEIAAEMHVRPRTVDNYRDALFEKLNVNSRVGIAMYAIRNQIVQI